VRIAILALALSMPCQAAFTLAAESRSAYSIVLPRSATASERHAAGELQRFLEQMSGARLPVVHTHTSGPAILLQADPKAFHAEQFRIETQGENLVLTGGRPRGLLYAVYTLLDRLGCRWYTAEVSRIPRRATLTMEPLAETHAPDFEYREPFYREAFNGDWAARNRVNGNSMELDEAHGGRFRYYPFVHTFNALVPPDKYFQKHPEYFSLVDGARRPSQLCLTNPEVLRIATAQVLEWMRQHPEASIYSVSQNDGGGWCECDRCRRLAEAEGGRQSGPILHFVNAVAAQVEKHYPGRLLDTLAYAYTEAPPTHVRPRPNVRVRLCPINNCEAHRYDDPRCPHNVPFMKTLRGWAAIAHQLYIWHYNTNYSHFLLPFPNFDEYAADIPLYKRNGVVGVFLEGSYAANGGGEFAELKSWVMARLLWDTHADASRLTDEFLEAVYGPAAPHLRAYIELMNREVRFAPHGRGMHLWLWGMPEFSPNFVVRARKLFDRAEAAAPNELVRRRIRHQRLSVDYLAICRERAFSVRGATYEPAGGPTLQSRTLDIFTRMREFGINAIREGNPLDWNEQQARTYLRPFSLVSLEDATLRVDLAPDLGGRAVRILWKPGQRDLVRETDPAEDDYPNVGGLFATVAEDFRGKTWPVTWTALPDATPTRLTLAGTTANGLKLERTFMLDAGRLNVHTELRNASAAPVELVLRHRGEFRTESLRWAVRKPGGALDAVSLLTRGGPTNGLNSYWAADRPAGEWRIVEPRLGYTLVNRFERGQTAQCVMGWTAKDRRRISLTLFTPRTKLASGAALSLDSSYEVIATPQSAR
jgi:hypothetical protein